MPSQSPRVFAPALQVGGRVVPQVAAQLRSALVCRGEGEPRVCHWRSFLSETHALGRPRLRVSRVATWRGRGVGTLLESVTPAGSPSVPPSPGPACQAPSCPRAGGRPPGGQAGRPSLAPGKARSAPGVQVPGAPRLVLRALNQTTPESTDTMISLRGNASLFPAETQTVSPAP